MADEDKSNLLWQSVPATPKEDPSLTPPVPPRTHTHTSADKPEDPHSFSRRKLIGTLPKIAVTVQS